MIAAMWQGDAPDAAMQQEVVQQLRAALHAKQEAEAAMLAASRRHGAARTLAAHIISIKQRLIGAIARWCRAVALLAVESADLLSERSNRSVKALADTRGQALAEARATAMQATEEAKRATEELEAIKRAAAAADFRREGDRARREAFEATATQARQAEKRLRLDIRAAAIARVLNASAATRLARSFGVWRLSVAFLVARAARGRGDRGAAGANALALTYEGGGGGGGGGLLGMLGGLLAPGGAAPAGEALPQLTSQRPPTPPTAAVVRLGGLLARRRREALGGATHTWRRAASAVALRVAVEHARETHGLLKAERDQVVNGNERWRARAAAQLESRAGLLSGERSALQREWQVVEGQAADLARAQEAHAAAVAQERHGYAARLMLDSCLRLKHRIQEDGLRRWVDALAALDEQARNEEAEARMHDLSVHVAALERRPVGLQGAAESERRKRVEAEEAAKLAELKAVRLQRESAAAPAKVASPFTLHPQPATLDP